MNYSEVQKVLKGYIAARNNMQVYAGAINICIDQASPIYTNYYRERQINYIKARKALDAYARYIENLIMMLPNELHQRVMIDHYLNGLAWQAVADKNCYSIAQIYKFNSDAIDYIAAHVAASNIPLVEFS